MRLNETDTGDQKDQLDVMLKAYKESKSANDPIGLMVQVTALKSRRISIYMKAKLLALKVLEFVSKVLKL